MSGITPQQALINLKESNALLVDIRAPSDWIAGVPVEASLYSAEELIKSAAKLVQKYDQLMVLCYRGTTSIALVDKLNKLKEVYQSVQSCFVSIDGGYEAWKQLNLPIEIPKHIEQSRYERQMRLSEIGAMGQARLSDAHVLVIGAGGLGAPALLYLAAAGIGHITLVDDDVVSLHNLHRQILYQESDVGQAKSLMAEQHLRQLNSEIKITAVNQRCDAGNVDSLVKAADIVIDGSDNIKTRYLINDICLKFQKPWIFAAVMGFDVQLAVFNGDRSKPCYRCLFPDLEDEQLGNCNEAGILGVVPGLAAMLQINEAIKYIVGMSSRLEHKMLHYDMNDHDIKMLKYPDSINPSCKHHK